MNFIGNPIITEASLFELELEGNEFFLESFPDLANLTKTRFYIKRQIIDSDLEYPSHYSKNRYREQYGLYSVEMFTKNLRVLYESFRAAETIKDFQRMFVRKMWMFKKIFETFENSIELILVRMSKLIPNIYGKALNAIESAEVHLENCDARARKYTEISLVVIRRVLQKVVDILSERPQLFKLLSPPLLEQFVKDASPYMVAKIKCLPWIEPEIALLAEPKYNLYWTMVWHTILSKNFRFSSEICYEIAEYMPIRLRRETFLDYFRRKYNAKKGCFHGERAFEIREAIAFEGGYYLNNITIVL